MFSSAATTHLSLARQPISDETAHLITHTGWLPRVEPVGSMGAQNAMSFTQYCVLICNSTELQSHLLKVRNIVNNVCGQGTLLIVSSGASWWFVLAPSVIGTSGAGISCDASFSSLPL